MHIAVQRVDIKQTLQTLSVPVHGLARCSWHENMQDEENLLLHILLSGRFEPLQHSIWPNIKPAAGIKHYRAEFCVIPKEKVIGRGKQRCSPTIAEGLVWGGGENLSTLSTQKWDWMEKANYSLLSKEWEVFKGVGSWSTKNELTSFKQKRLE